MSMTKKEIRENIFTQEFVLGVIIPVLLFGTLDHYSTTVVASIIVGLWTLAIVMYEWLRKTTFNIFAGIGAVFTGIGLAGTLVTRDPLFFLVSPIVFDFILAAAFLGSLAFGKPLLLMMAEQTMKGGFSESTKSRPDFKIVWIILSWGWGILCLSQAFLRIVLLNTAPMAVYYAVSSAYGNISTPMFLVFSFWFPGWYWRRNSQLGKEGSQ